MIHRADVEFESRGVTCRAWHYRPRDDDFADSAGAPCIVMAPGFGATREFGLEPYAERFADASLHVLLFDYRHWGASDGEPRNLISIRRQLQDWRAAVGCARSLAGVDPRRIALWGTSYSGGHVVVVAARDGRIAAVAAQAPSMDGNMVAKSLVRYAGVRQVLRLIGAGLRDAGRAITGREPFRIPVAGPPGSLAAMTAWDALDGYLALAPPDWRNEYCARANLTLGLYRPRKKARTLPCPILIQSCKRDTLEPHHSAAVTARSAGANATYLRYDIGHFDIYRGICFERAVADQLEFFARHLRPGCRTAKGDHSTGAGRYPSLARRAS